MNRQVKGYILACVAASTYGLNPLFALTLYADGMDSDSVLFFRYLLALPVVGAMLKMRGNSFVMPAKQLSIIVVLGLLFATSSLTLFLSYHYMAAGIASTILFVYPILVAVIMGVFFHEKISKATMVCIVLATLGIALLYNGPAGARLSLHGTVLVLVSALSYAIYIVGVNMDVLKRVATLKVTFWALLSGLMIFVVRLVMAGSITLPHTPLLWLNLIALAVFPTAISLMCTTTAIQYIGSTPTAILGALEPLTAIVIGVAVFHEEMTPRIFCGLAMIILAVTVVVAGGKLPVLLNRLKKMFPKKIRHIHI